MVKAMNCSRGHGTPSRRAGRRANGVQQVFGYSLLEMAVVVAMIMIALAVGVLSFPTALRHAHINSAVQTTVNQLRMAREESVDRRMLYTVTFVPPSTITTQRTVKGQPPVTERSITVPSD